MNDHISATSKKNFLLSNFQINTKNNHVVLLEIRIKIARRIHIQGLKKQGNIITTNFAVINI